MAAPFEKAFEDFARRQEEASKFTSESAPEGVREGGSVVFRVLSSLFVHSQLVKPVPEARKAF